MIASFVRSPSLRSVPCFCLFCFYYLPLPGDFWYPLWRSRQSAFRFIRRVNTTVKSGTVYRVVNSTCIFKLAFLNLYFAHVCLLAPQPSYTYITRVTSLFSFFLLLTYCQYWYWRPTDHNENSLTDCIDVVTDTEKPRLALSETTRRGCLATPEDPSALPPHRQRLRIGVCVQSNTEYATDCGLDIFSYSVVVNRITVIHSATTAGRSYVVVSIPSIYRRLNPEIRHKTCLGNVPCVAIHMLLHVLGRCVRCIHCCLSSASIDTIM